MWKAEKFHKVLFYLVLVFAAALPVSIALAEPAAFLAIPCFLLACPRKARPQNFNGPFTVPILAFTLIVLVSIFWSIRPDASAGKLHVLLLLAMVFILPFGVKGKRFPMDAWWLPLLAFSAGATMLALHDLIRVPLALWKGHDLFSTGNMRDPQLYMVSVCFLLATLAYPQVKRFRPWVSVALALNIFGVIVHFKRGVWVACALTILVMASVSKRKRWVISLVLVIGAMLLAPPVQERLSGLGEVFSRDTGGRYVLWTRVAPQLLRAYPEGMGWAAVQHEDFNKFARYVQPGLDHLHNNILQVALQIGWAGLAIWLAWMGITFRVLWSVAKSSRGDEGISRALAGLGCLGAFLGLMLNGMVEHNFGDTEILMTLALIMGVSLCLWRSHREQEGS